MDFSKRKSSKASISIPPTQIPLPRASLNKLPAQLRKPNLGGARRKPRGKNSRARRLAKGCEQQQPCAQVAGSKQRGGTGGKRPVAKFLARGKAKAKSWADIKLAVRALWLSKTLASRKRAQRCRECRLDCAKPRRKTERFQS